MLSTKETEAVTVLTDSMMYEDEVPARNKANEAEAPVGSVPRLLRNDARPARGGGPLKLADKTSLFSSLLATVTFFLSLVARLRCV